MVEEDKVMVEVAPVLIDKQYKAVEEAVVALVLMYKQYTAAAVEVEMAAVGKLQPAVVVEAVVQSKGLAGAVTVQHK